MCLYLIDKEKPPATGFMWKVFKEDYDGHLVTAVFPSPPLRRGKWVAARSPRIFATSGVIYNAGWHGFPNRSHARVYISGNILHNYKVIKVKYRKVICSGMQRPDLATIVAHEILIPRKSTKRKR